MRILSLCLALAAGEYLASFFPVAYACWPLSAVLAVLVLLFGYGLSLRGWPLLFSFLVGLSLFLHASTANEVKYRSKPWLRGRERQQERSVRKSAGLRADIRRNFSQRLSIGVDARSDTTELSRAMLLGERHHLSPRIKRTFVESGTMHVFAISGLHVMVVSGVLAFLWSLTGMPRRFVGAVALPLLWGYVHLIGDAPSAVRAAMMATFSGLAPLFWRRPNGLWSWSLTFLAVHMLDPLMIVNVGSALSFAVMLAIVLAGDATRHMARGWQTVVMTVVIWMAGVPISAHVFGRMTPGGMLANLALISAAEFSVLTGMLGVLSSCFSDALAAHFNNLNALGVQAMMFIADGVARLPFSSIQTGRWPLLACFSWCVLCAGVLLAILRFTRNRSIP